MGWRVDPPGFRYDARTKVARFSIVVPGTNAMRRRKKTIAAPTRDKALDLWKEFHDDVVKGDPVPEPAPGPVPMQVPVEKPEPLTLDSYVAKHFAARKNRVRPATWSSYEWATRAYILPRFGTCAISSITMPAIRDFAGDLASRRLSPSTINRILAVVRLLVLEAFERGCIDKVGLRGRLPFQRESVLRLELSDDERRRFLAAFDDRASFASDLETHRVLGPKKQPTGGKWSAPRRFGASLKPESEAAGRFFERFQAIRPVFVVSLETGLRVGDLLGLRWSRVDRAAGWIRLTVQKTGREATIPLTSACRGALETLWSRRQDHGYVCTEAEGKRLAAGALRSYFGRAKRLAGIARRCRLHDLRHTLGARLSSSGANLQAISAVLGHSTTRLSERYSHPSQASIETAFKKMETDEATDGAALPPTAESEIASVNAPEGE